MSQAEPVIERLRRRVEEFKAKRAAGQVEPIGVRIRRRVEEIRARRQAMWAGRSSAKSESPVIEEPAVRTYQSTSPVVEVPKIRTY